MGSFSGWILSIAGVALVGVLIDIILPNGKIQKYIKSVFAFTMVLVIILPLPTLLKREVDIEGIINKNEIILQTDYIYQLNRDRLDDLQNDIEQAIEEQGLAHVSIAISADIFTTNLQIEAVFVDTTNMVIIAQDKHINTNDIIKNAILSKVNIKKEQIIFNER